MLAAAFLFSMSAAFGQAEKTISSMKEGAKLTDADIAIMDFQKDYKAPDASRGAGMCYYWYYYCDGWGYCYWYKYWYYC